jgi:hypothetical protein
MVAVAMSGPLSSVSGLRSENLEVVLTVRNGVPTFSSLTLGLVTLFVLPFFVPMINFQQDLIVELYGGRHSRQRFTQESSSHMRQTRD